MSFLGDIFNTGKDLIGGLAPMAGTALGTMFGGPMGGMLGGTLGGGLGNLIRGGGGGGGGQQAPQQQQQQQQFNPGQAGGQFGQQLGQSAYQAMSPYLPQGAGNRTLGQNLGHMGGQFGNYMGQQIQQRMPQQNFGQMAGRFGDFVGRNMPGRYGQQFGQGLGRMLQGGLNSAGYGQMSPYQMAQNLPQQMQRYGSQLGGRGAGMLTPYVGREMMTMPLREMPQYAGQTAGRTLGQAAGQRYLPQQQPPQQQGGGEEEDMGLANMYGNEGYAHGGHVHGLRGIADYLDSMNDLDYEPEPHEHHRRLPHYAHHAG